MILIFVWTIKISVVTEETGASAGHVLQIRADHLQPPAPVISPSTLSPRYHWLSVIIIFSEVKIELSAFWEHTNYWLYDYSLFSTLKLWPQQILDLSWTQSKEIVRPLFVVPFHVQIKWKLSLTPKAFIICHPWRSTVQNFHIFFDYFIF